MAPGCVMIADMGMVLMMVVPCFVVVGETPLMLRMVGLFPAPPAWEVVIMVVGLPSAEDTSFRMVPAGSGPLVCGERGGGGGVMPEVLDKCTASQEFNAPPLHRSCRQLTCRICARGFVEPWPVTADVCTGLVCTTDIILPRLEICGHASERDYSSCVRAISWTPLQRAGVTLAALCRGLSSVHEVKTFTVNMYTNRVCEHI